MNIFIGGAWPYANGSLHLGHIASLLPGDVLARYHRLKGDNVLYVSGSDCNGTPIVIRAKREGVSPTEIADRYHEEFHACFTKLGFTFDHYTRTDATHHHETVHNIFLQLLANGYIYQKEIQQTYCETCAQFLPDRYVEGNCPHCGQHARGDQCDFCSTILDPMDLLDKTCQLCGTQPTVRDTKHFYLALQAFQERLEKYVEDYKQNWRDNAVQLTERYLREGLQDRAASRDLPVGVSVPVAGYEEKKIYVWIEAVSGYYSAGRHNPQFWQSDTKTYYVHGKDNIPFHTIIWPAILMGTGNSALPQYIVSNEYLTLEKKKISTSRNWAVWVPDVLERYHPDSLRYFLTMNAPENRDTDFSWREFIYSHNSELLGAYGNFVNRTLKFAEKNYGCELPVGQVDAAIKMRIEALYPLVGGLIEETSFKQALEEIFSHIRGANKYFDEREPWKHVGSEGCANTIVTCMYLIANFAQLLHPFLPFSSQTVQGMLGLDELGWGAIEPPAHIHHVQPLFARIDVKQIEEELQRLHHSSIKS
ncbi:methionine--tRNA ligase [Ectobacillus sp. JY-23]|uniref:methionine--tRNA ligase n=1 Tax=Ectobacillus sp. JY-23 TaxID=2933872 RepID=UPI001FF29E47|nr:methionine--tRNA ligase [Ectobacillus sp. JY-23]UOY91041.1 methionine--tRNA ligase [Ectobacillus sp. JY-23]